VLRRSKMHIYVDGVSHFETKRCLRGKHFLMK
jgi:hypothetical protein